MIGLGLLVTVLLLLGAQGTDTAAAVAAIAVRPADQSAAAEPAALVELVVEARRLWAAETAPPIGATIELSVEADSIVTLRALDEFPTGCSFAFWTVPDRFDVQRDIELRVTGGTTATAWYSCTGTPGGTAEPRIDTFVMVMDLARSRQLDADARFTVSETAGPCMDTQSVTVRKLGGAFCLKRAPDCSAYTCTASGEPVAATIEAPAAPESPLSGHQFVGWWSHGSVPGRTISLASLPAIVFYKAPPVGGGVTLTVASNFDLPLDPPPCQGLVCPRPSDWGIPFKVGTMGGSWLTQRSLYRGPYASGTYIALEGRRTERLYGECGQAGKVCARDYASESIRCTADDGTTWYSASLWYGASPPPFGDPPCPPTSADNWHAPTRVGPGYQKLEASVRCELSYRRCIKR